MVNKTHIPLTGFQIWSFFALGIVRNLALFVMGWFRIIDPGFFTYQNFLLSAVLFYLYAVMLWSQWSRRLFFYIALPIYWGTPIFVGIAIVVILKLNGGDLMLKTVDIFGGPNSIGDIHTGDYLIHQWPWIEVVLFTWFNWPAITAAFALGFAQADTLGKVVYSLYLLLVPFGILLFYMVNFDFIGNYPTHLPDWAVIAAVVATAILVQAVLYVTIYFNIPHTQTPPPDEKKGL